MTKYFFLKLQNLTVTQQRRLSRKYIYKYIYKSATQSGDRAITQSYTVQQSPTDIYFKYYQSALLNLTTG